MSAPSPAPAPAPVSGAGDRPPANTTRSCLECWHHLSGYDEVSAVTYQPTHVDHRQVLGFVHLECSERARDRFVGQGRLDRLTLRVVALV